MPRSRSRSFEIHRALGNALVLPERARLLEEPVDERGFAMIDMGNDRDVAQLHGSVVKSGCYGVVKPQRAPRGPQSRL